VPSGLFQWALARELLNIAGLAMLTHLKVAADPFAYGVNLKH